MSDFIMRGVIPLDPLLISCRSGNACSQIITAVSRHISQTHTVRDLTRATVPSHAAKFITDVTLEEVVVM